MDINITPIIEAVIALVTAVITIVVIPWVRSKTTDAQRQQMIAWVTWCQIVYGGKMCWCDRQWVNG